MTDIRSISRDIGSLNRYPADYLDIDWEESQSSRITYRGRELESVDRSTSVGGNVRGSRQGRLGICQLQ